MTSELILKNARIVSTNKIIDFGWLVIQGKKITKIQSGDFHDVNYGNNKNITIIDCLNKTIIPGFIDIHVHGGYGYSFIDEKNELKDSLNNFAQVVVQEGVTKFCCATVTSKKPVLDQFFTQLGSYMQEKQPEKQAQVLGAYLEGPFISLEYKGAHDPNLLVAPNIEWIKQWKQLSNNSLKFVAFALECDQEFNSETNNFTTLLIKNDIIPSLAHSAATFKQVKQAQKYGLNHVTHLYNGMSGFNHRFPGCVPTILDTKDMQAELICDGVHVDLDIIKLTYKIKGAENIIMVSDAISAKGCSDGEYHLGSLAIVKKGSVATLKDNHLAISGSVATMIEGFKNLLKITNNNWQDCIKMASYNSAKQLKLDDIIGDIQENKLADLLVLNQDNDVDLTICEGQIAFKK
ncbi:N-acetylglucosamine-6-phosphate deacetylase [Spiroplasma platyhelix]|uniref:N-acetylglucosamine-6-phosphate deacetylase n=1 Tax=Spiroplasma platyhelix PALS-1 TaxID=1276218 RepID=A0A846TT82_9MOLU|nr:N-acetylglucosamine-6-phosphate deacetylase [Spiroplasma platyhelix]MBE4704343.1 N-acetylglucosamine-6-phosphate deacetylase [Spiroplasma platyhelix PALS-1]NKE38715.1 N-acetylglucosamine-6-phosphate deacetylase [Spiroplasma platyhelix PALS-1]UJB28925.1 N-acetylglucosamine-6-phosphate deacetylase [Spiroplasma platyhelix PALS-1]